MDSPDGKSLSEAKFTETCCQDSSEKRCSDYKVDWINAARSGGGCRKDQKAFFDLKKAKTTVGSDTHSDIAAKCCTPVSEATCGDWEKTCPSGTFLLSKSIA